VRPLRPYLILIVLLPCAAALYAQTAPLPPGTSMPDSSSATPSSRAAALIAQAEDDIVRADYAKALPMLNDAVVSNAATSQQKARALYDRGYIKQAQQQPSAAEADFREAIAADPKQFEAHAALGQMLAQRQQWKDAQQQLQLAAAVQPASGNRPQLVADVDRTLAHVDAQLHDDVAASEALLAALRRTPEQNDDTLLAAQLAEDAKNYAGAEQEFKKVLATDPKSIAAAEGLARALIHQEKYAEAEPVLEKALLQQPKNPVLLAESATALAGEGKTQNAITQLETLHRQNPKQPAVTRMLADLYSSAGQAASAAPLYWQLLTADPGNPGLLTAAAENLLHERKWPQAVQMFQRSLHIEPKQSDAWSGLAFAASEDARYALVLTALDHRAQSVPDTPAVLFLRATALDHLHRTKEAIPYYRKFLVAAKGKFPDEEAQVRQRLTEFKKAH